MSREDAVYTITSQTSQILTVNSDAEKTGNDGVSAKVLFSLR
jgi:hypothetical protein